MEFIGNFLSHIWHAAIITGLTSIAIGGGIFYKENKNKELGIDQQVTEYIVTLSTIAAITGSIAGAILLILVC